jgi:hypothetical protein
MTTAEKFKEIFDSGYFVFQNIPKRIDGEWEERIIWKRVEEPGDRYIEDCDWEGFTNIDDCLDDCLKYIETLRKKHETV